MPVVVADALSVRDEPCLLSAAVQRGCGPRVRNYMCLCLNGLWLSMKINTRFTSGFKEEALRSWVGRGVRVPVLQKCEPVRDQERFVSSCLTESPS